MGYLRCEISIQITAARASSLAPAQPQSRNADGLTTSCAGSIASVWVVRGVLEPTLQPLCHRARCRAAGRLAHALRLPSQQLLRAISARCAKGNSRMFAGGLVRVP